MNPDSFAALRQRAVAQIQAPITAYFDKVEKLKADDPQRVALAAGVQAQLETILRDLHVAAGVAGANGRLSNDQAQLVRERIAEQYQYLAGFMAALPKMSRGAALVRAAMYADAVIATALEMVKDELELPQRPGDGQTECEWHCRCTLEIQKLRGVGNWDVYWRLKADAEHCPDCVRLMRQWRPLKVRKGKIQNVKALAGRDLDVLIRLVKLATFNEGMAS